MRSGGRVVEGARLESVYTSKAYRGFESHPLRQALPQHLSPALRGRRAEPRNRPHSRDPIRHWCDSRRPSPRSFRPAISLARLRLDRHRFGFLQNREEQGKLAKSSAKSGRSGGDRASSCRKIIAAIPEGLRERSNRPFPLFGRTGYFHRAVTGTPFAHNRADLIRGNRLSERAASQALRRCSDQANGIASVAQPLRG